jgi:DNA polymerase-3 subunit epsilon
VYRFLRKNGDLLYVGKATSVKKRVAGHFRGGGQPNERALELLTQVHDIAVTETPTILEAALLESDEIKRLAPPYNVQLRAEERSVWYARRDLSDVAAVPDAVHSIGPLPSRRALAAFHALIALCEDTDEAAGLRARALSVPQHALPDPELFEAGFRAFATEHLASGTSGARRVDRAARALWLARGRSEPEAEPEVQPTSAAPDSWDLARVRRRLERGLTQGGLLVRRARFLCLLADADIGFREPGLAEVRVLSIARGEIVARHALPRMAELAALPARRVGSRRERQACFDAVVYDRLRVLATELNRVLEGGGEVALRLGTHTLDGARLGRLMRWI